MTAAEFRDQFRRHLLKYNDRILLRIVVGPDSSPPVELTGGEILSKAERLASGLVQADPSGVVLLLLPHSLELFLLHLGLVLEGRVPGILPWPTSRVDPEKYHRNLVHQLDNLPAQQLITTPSLAASLSGRVLFPVKACPIQNAADFVCSAALPVTPRTNAPAKAMLATLPTDVLFLQFSGGTTGSQKAVAVTASMHAAQLDRLGKSLNFTERDGVVSWLPMYHDMGLIACLWFPLWHGAPSLHFSASAWLLNPKMLLHYIDELKATFCWLPNFAFSYMAGRRSNMEGSCSLERVRGWINCSEPVRLGSMRKFVEAFSDWGVRMESMQASYAMAENVFAVTQTAMNQAPVTCSREEIQPNTASYSNLAYDMVDRVYISSGKLLDGMQLRIMDGDRECGEREPGEIQLRSDCLFTGYWGADGFQKSSLHDGWYDTGDYGFQVGEDTFVIGRMKDIVIVGGQNVFPEDVETVVNTQTGIYPGRVVAFGVEDTQYGTEALAIVAEMQGLYAPQIADSLAQQIRGLVLSAIGIAARHVVVVPERWIVKSTAGKISRRDTRRRFLEHFRTESPQPQTQTEAQVLGQPETRVRA